jgi:nucleotide-binding universal stress UspA family protein
MPHRKRVLLAVDDSEASRRAVAYVADVVGGASGFHAGLFHLQLPPRMLEWGGSEDAEVEDRISSERGEAYRQMEEKATAAGKALLQRFQAILAERGIDVAILLVQFEEPLNRKNVAASILKTAREGDYGTVAVGRHLFSLWESFFRHHVGEELVRTGEGITIWVVG